MNWPRGFISASTTDAPVPAGDGVFPCMDTDRETALLARQLLGQGCTPAEAAAQAGYQDYSTFSRAYKKQFGHGPSADAKGKQQDLQITTQEF